MLIRRIWNKLCLDLLTSLELVEGLEFLFLFFFPFLSLRFALLLFLL